MTLKILKTMNKFSFEITIEAVNSQDAEAKVAAAIILLRKLNTKEIRKLADIVQNDPIKTALAKKALGV
jgi:phosphotransferase system HPr-like phosphotransfer protein